MPSCIAALIQAALVTAAIAQPAAKQPPKPADAKPAAQPAAPAHQPGSEKPAAQPPAGDAAPAAPRIQFPHPLITEVLFDVPTGDAGDATGDGSRNATGDEFIELANPHSKPIQLGGYVITDAAGWPGKLQPNPDSPRTRERSVPQRDRKSTKPNAKPNTQPDSPPAPGAKPEEMEAPKPGEARRGAVRFVFPPVELKPGEVVVVFNGFKQSFKGPVGDSKHAPAGPNPNFAGAYVFTMRLDSNFNSFSNTGDWVTLSSPQGTLLEAVRWGMPDFLPPAGVEAEEVPPLSGSVTRASFSDPLVPHGSLPSPAGDRLMSPGQFPPGAVPESTPDPKTDNTPRK